MNEHRAALLALFAAVLTQTPVGQRVAAIGWLPELSGRCWNNAALRVQTCYWQLAPDRLQFLSRSGDDWLECGVLIAGRAAPAIVSVTWSETGIGDTLALSLTGDSLLFRETRPGAAEGMDRATVLTRPRAGQFGIRPVGQSVPTRRRAAAGGASAATLRFTAGRAFRGDDPAAERCLALGGRDAQVP